MVDDADLLLEVLNSTPVVEGRPTDRWAARGAVADALERFGAQGTAREATALRRVRALLQDAVRAARVPDALADTLAGVRRAPVLRPDGVVTWELQVPADRRLAVRAVLAWAAVQEQAPGRLRPCANDECRLFLLDRSKPNTARWCSMAGCGNRLKARRHHARVTGTRARAQDPS